MVENKIDVLNLSEEHIFNLKIQRLWSSVSSLTLSWFISSHSLWSDFGNFSSNPWSMFLLVCFGTFCLLPLLGILLSFILPDKIWLSFKSPLKYHLLVKLAVTSMDNGSNILLWFLRTLCSSLTPTLNCEHFHPENWVILPSRDYWSP